MFFANFFRFGCGDVQVGPNGKKHWDSHAFKRSRCFRGCFSEQNEQLEGVKKVCDFFNTRRLFLGGRALPPFCRHESCNNPFRSRAKTEKTAAKFRFPVRNFAGAVKKSFFYSPFFAWFVWFLNTPFGGRGRAKGACGENRPRTPKAESPWKRQARAAAAARCAERSRQGKQTGSVCRERPT